MHCKDLVSATIPNSVSSITTQAFWECSSLTNVIIPNSVSHIGSYAFMFCSSLKSITIPISVENIDTNAFAKCENLVIVYCEPTQPPMLGISVFASNAENRKIYVPASNDDSIINTYKTTAHWSDYADYIFEDEQPSGLVGRKVQREHRWDTRAIILMLRVNATSQETSIFSEIL